MNRHVCVYFDKLLQEEKKPLEKKKKMVKKIRSSIKSNASKFYCFN